jgi:hypothetical protein
LIYQKDHDELARRIARVHFRLRDRNLSTLCARPMATLSFAYALTGDEFPQTRSQEDDGRRLRFIGISEQSPGRDLQVARMGNAAA